MSVLYPKLLRVFRGNFIFEKPLDIINAPTLQRIEVVSFPHIEKLLTILCILVLPPKFHCEISCSIFGTDVEYDVESFDAPDQKAVVFYKQEPKEIIFPKYGLYCVQLKLNGEYFISLPFKLAYKNLNLN